MLSVEDISRLVLEGKAGKAFHGSILRKSDKLLKVRLWVYSISFVHLIIMATKLLTIDFAKAEDPSVWIYNTFKLKFVTCWFNLISLIYLPVCIYCDWMELRYKTRSPLVKGLNYFRFLTFTSILFPTTTFADILFWRLWNKDRELIAPAAVDELVPFWMQHCMHTVSLVVAILDLILVPRKRPKHFTLGLTIMGTFIVAYLLVCIDSCMKGEYLYPVLKKFNVFESFVLALYIIVEHLFYYFGQFIINDLIWGHNYKEKSHAL